MDEAQSSEEMLASARGEDVDKIESMPDPPISVRMDPSHPENLHGDLLDELQQMVHASRRHIQQREEDWNQVDEMCRLYIDLRRGARRGDGTRDPVKREMPYKRSVRTPLLYSTIATRAATQFGILDGRDPFIHLQPRESNDFRGARLHEAVSAYDMEQSQISLQTWQMIMSSEKYGLGIWYDTWEQDYGNIPSTADELGIPPEMAQMLRIPVEDRYGLTREWNNVRCIDPHYLLPDPAFPVVDVQSMGYIGHTDFISWLYLDERRLTRDQGPYFNVDLARQMGKGPVDRRRWDSRSNEGGFTSDNHDRKYPVLPLVRMQWKIIPSEWKLSDGDRPEVWWFEALADKEFTLKLIVRAHKMPNAHNEFSYSIGEGDYDAHAPFQPGMGQLIIGMQETTDWMINSHLANSRKMINDQVIYNDDLLSRVDMNSPMPAKHIRLTRKGKGLHERGLMSIGQMYGQFAITDVTRGHLETAQQFLPMTQRMAATPDTLQGMPLPSKRTLGEVEGISQAATMRLGIAAQLLDQQVIGPMARRLISNRQQFTSLEQYFRLAGRLAEEFGIQAMMIRPDDLAGGYDYVVRTPTMPADPARSAALYGSVLQILAQAPQLMNPNAEGKAINPQAIFEEFLKANGISHYDQFYMQVAPTGQAPGQAQPQQPGGAPGSGQGHVENNPIMDEGEILRQVQMGNMIPM